MSQVRYYPSDEDIAFTGEVAVTDNGLASQF